VTSPNPRSVQPDPASGRTDEQVWNEPVLVRTLHPDDGYRCGVAGDCDEPAEWSVELAGLNGRDEEPEDEAPHADACMAHLGWVAGALLPKPPEKAEEAWRECCHHCTYRHIFGHPEPCPTCAREKADTPGSAS
jgi:hypothetical protein